MLSDLFISFLKNIRVKGFFILKLNYRWLKGVIEPNFMAQQLQEITIVPNQVTFEGGRDVQAFYFWEGKNKGSKGIRQWPTRWCTSPMLVHKITPYLDYN